MTVPVWPSSLPQGFDGEGYSETLPDLALASKTEVGPAMVRRRATAGVRLIAGKLPPVTVEQLDTLEDFYLTTLKGGTLRFRWTVQRAVSGELEYRFVAGKPPRWEIKGGTIIVSLDLEVLP